MDVQMTERPIAELPYAAIDFESAGAAPGETDLPIQVGMLCAPSLFAPVEFFTTYLACERPVRWSASRLHGITTADLKGIIRPPSDVFCACFRRMALDHGWIRWRWRVTASPLYRI